MRTDTGQMPVPARVTACGRTHAGCRRAENEDRMFVGERVFAVADGIGGRRGGDVAAETALTPVAALDRARDGVGLEVALRDAFQQANADVRARRRAEPALQRMGTTLTAVVVSGTHAHVAHVGDSRLYRLRDGALEQLTTDHTLVQQLVDDGRLSPAGAQDHPRRNVITRAIGTDAHPDVDVTVTDIVAGDTLLLCSDGLPGALDEQGIGELLGTHPDPAEAVDALVLGAVAAGARDNVTAVALRPG